MKLAAIKKAVTSYVNALKRDELKVQFRIVRGALDDVMDNKDAFHLEQLADLLFEMKHSPEYAQSEKTLKLLDSALSEVDKER
jgi:hypothetical protein